MLVATTIVVSMVVTSGSNDRGDIGIAVVVIVVAVMVVVMLVMIMTMVVVVLLSTANDGGSSCDSVGGDDKGGIGVSGGDNDDVNEGCDGSSGRGSSDSGESSISSSNGGVVTAKSAIFKCEKNMFFFN